MCDILLLNSAETIAEAHFHFWWQTLSAFSPSRLVSHHLSKGRASLSAHLHFADLKRAYNAVLIHVPVTLLLSTFKLSEQIKIAAKWVQVALHSWRIQDYQTVSHLITTFTAPIWSCALSRADVDLMFHMEVELQEMLKSGLVAPPYVPPVLNLEGVLKAMARDPNPIAVMERYDRRHAELRGHIPPL